MHPKNMQHKSESVIRLSAEDLLAGGVVTCPSPRAGMPEWASHPKVFLHLNTSGKAQCPYCGGVYQLTSDK